MAVQSRIHTSEDHNDQGTQVPRFPRKWTRYTLEDFSDGVKTHSVMDETSIARVLYKTSDEALECFLPCVPRSDVSGTWRLEPRMYWDASQIVEDGRSFDITLSDAETSATISFEVLEY